MANKNRKIVGLKCTDCGLRNYTMYKPNNLQEKLEVKKHCKRCGKHTGHIETKAWK